MSGTMGAPTPSDQAHASDPIAAPRPSWPRWILAAFLVVAITAFYMLGLFRYFSWDYTRDHLDKLKTSVEEHRLTALLVFFLLYLTMAALSLPAAWILSLLAGALFGRWLGTSVVSLASTLGATLAFLSSRYLFREGVQHRFSNRLHTLNEGVKKDGAYYLFTLRLVPVVPFFLINLGMGLTPMRTWTFAWVSMLGMLPGTFVYVNTGRELGQIQSPADIRSPGVLIALALLGVAPLMFRQLVRWFGRGVIAK